MSGHCYCFPSFRWGKSSKRRIELKNHGRVTPTALTLMSGHYLSSSGTVKYRKSPTRSEELKLNTTDFEDQFSSLPGRILRSSVDVSQNSCNFERLLDLEKEKAGWKMRACKSYLHIYTKREEEQFMAKAMFDLEIDANPNALYHLMYNTQARKKWDKLMVTEFYNIECPANDVEHYYMLCNAPSPFLNREFIEKRYTRKKDNGDLEVFYCDSPHPRFPEPSPKKGVIRAKTLFGGTLIRRRISKMTGESTLLLTVICQADMKENLPSEILEQTLPVNLMNWYRNIKKQLVCLSLNEN